MSWSAHLVQTMTGRVGEQLDLATGPSWTIPLNGIEDLTVTAPRAQLREIDPLWRRPRMASVLLCWESEALGRVPWILAPISQRPTEDRDTDSAQFTCRGIGMLLEKRTLFARDFAPGEESDLVKSVFSRKGMSLGTIAQDIVRASTEEKVGGYLPLRYASPREVASGLNERNYEGHNMANNGTWKLLTELTEVINGPDIAFRPEFVDDSPEYVRWAMYHGTRAQPTIAQEWMMDLDATAPEGPVVDLVPKFSDSERAQKVYWTGAGEGAGVLARTAFNINGLANHDPLVEVVGSTSDSENPELIQAHADAALANGSDTLLQLSVTIDGSDPDAEIGRWRVGDAAWVKTEGWLDVADGRHQRRIISAKGGGGTEVTLEFQEDTW